MSAEVKITFDAKGCPIYVETAVTKHGIEVKITDNRDCLVHKLTIKRDGSTTVKTSA